jgi:hypothetical protein
MDSARKATDKAMVSRCIDVRPRTISKCGSAHNMSLWHYLRALFVMFGQARIEKDMPTRSLVVCELCNSAEPTERKLSAILCPCLQFS